MRSEGAGFQIVDVLSAFDYSTQTDPFLIWHELPRKKYRPGEMPGAPMHPHRGFSEVPYCKLLENSEKYPPLGKTRVNRVDRDNKMYSGDLEWGKCANGIEHEFLMDDNWSGEMHFFQLWVNLPGAHKRDPPEFQNAAAAAMPKFRYKDSIDCKILVGELDGHRSPVECQHSRISYMDFENPSADEVVVPLNLERRIVYFYRGTCELQGHKVSRGQVYLLGPGSELRLERASSDLGFLLIQGMPMGEPCAQYGPFVMTNTQEIRQCFADHQRGELTNKSANYKRYE